MYIELVRDIVLKSIERHVRNSGLAREQVLEQIKNHILDTSDEYFKEIPVIEYQNPLCRLGYLYMNAPANATLFERVLNLSQDAQDKVASASDGVLSVCSLGGGPGTEMLGLAKHYLQRRDLQPPRKIAFTVLDNISEWSDTWSELGEAAENELRTSLSFDPAMAPTIAPMFLPYDVMDGTQFDLIQFQLERADIVVFNYLLSENKSRLATANPALARLRDLCSPGCCFVVIDRLERNTTFTNDVVHLFEDVFGLNIQHQMIGGTLDGDEQVNDMGDMLLETLGRFPRVTFRTKLAQHPTVFWFAIRR